MRRNWLLALTAVCVLATGANAQTGEGSIAAYLDDAGTQCEAIIGGPVTTGSIWMNLAGSTATGITGVEFRCDNSNSSAYAVSFIADPAANVSLGNPFLGGVNVAFPSCQTGTGGRVKVGQLVIQEMSHSADVSLTVRQHFSPSNPNFQCALAVLCDAPVYSTVCVGAVNSDHWRAVLNPSDGVSGDCQPVAVAPTSWTRMKALYN